MGRIAGVATLFLVLVLGACSPPAELARPVTPPDVAARTLLPPGRIEAIKSPPATDGAQVTADGGGRMTALRFASTGDAVLALDALAKRVETRAGISSRSRVAIGSLQYLRYSGGSTFGLAWVSGPWVFSAEAASADRLVDLIAASRVGGVEDKGQLKWFPWVIAGIVLLSLAVGALLLRRLLRSQVVAPATGATAVSREKLIARLMALNDPSRPWLVRTGPEADLVVEWKYADATWWGIMAKQGVRETYRLRLYLNEATHRVGALDETSEIEWSGGLMGTPSFRYSKSGFRGVQLFKRKREVAYGFDTPAGGGFGKQLDVNFDLDSLKQPVIAAVTAAGWSYSPVMRPQ
ncbi:hypothetical protein [Bradyrhizobium sp.]|uniref:hypothetical protein n=1 Tax=Bradyrhizobium sp. TaxID=376 RepID=UPI001D2B77E8|nr:hypothetical protein [Bradyrhizobium sp.]MBI5322362.1 hypothetical protein [Bradyrhizobium sp.]